MQISKCMIHYHKYIKHQLLDWISVTRLKFLFLKYAFPLPPRKQILIFTLMNKTYVYAKDLFSVRLKIMRIDLLFIFIQITHIRNTLTLYGNSLKHVLWYLLRVWVHSAHIMNKELGKIIIYISGGVFTSVAIGQVHLAGNLFLFLCILTDSGD